MVQKNSAFGSGVFFEVDDVLRRIGNNLNHAISLCSIQAIHLFIFFLAVFMKRPNAFSFFRLSRYDIS
jgi:hypothetical protein